MDIKEFKIKLKEHWGLWQRNTTNKWIMGGNEVTGAAYALDMKFLTAPSLLGRAAC